MNSNDDLYKETLRHAASQGALQMRRIVGSVRESMYARERSRTDIRERQSIAQSINLLDQHEAALCSRFPDTLSKIFSGEIAVSGRAATLNLPKLRFDQLELMDETQVMENVEMARSQQIVVLASEHTLADLNALICGLQGLAVVRPEKNPLRPETYLQALHSVVQELGLQTSVRHEWVRTMCVAMGAELRDMYAELAQKLTSDGAVAAGYAVIQMPSGHVSKGGDPGKIAAETIPNSKQAVESGKPSGQRNSDSGRPGNSTGLTSRPRRDEKLLTLDKLRRLLAGELDQQINAQPDDSFADRFSREFDGRFGHREAQATDFQSTVPAAFETLTEMKQVDQVMKKLQNRTGQPVGQDATLIGSTNEIRDHLRRSANGLGQSLSLEVVTLMMDNIAEDTRLLPLIRNLIRKLEPAMLRLAMVDPRFFSDKQHPARNLLQEITNRSMSFHDETASEFQEFLVTLGKAVEPLSGILIDSSEPFSVAMANLTQAWEQRNQENRKKLELAKQALESAEIRNRLAKGFSKEAKARPEALHAPAFVMDFLTGPWAQVVAQVELMDPSSGGESTKFRNVVGRLLWSTQPSSIKGNLAELARLIPQMLEILRDGLARIQYPVAETGDFFDALMNLHQQMLRPAQSKLSNETTIQPQDMTTMPVVANLRDDHDLWLAPGEARASGFMEFAPDETALAPLNGLEDTSDDVVAEISSLGIGSWVELKVHDSWVRTQLTWASPQNKLFLFTSAFGNTQSMTRRLRDRLFAKGKLRVIAETPILDVALDAVAQKAQLNSLDVAL